jgi:glutamine synthetase
MTALTKYQRLECVGLWRLTANAQLREVVAQTEALRTAIAKLEKSETFKSDGSHGDHEKEARHYRDVLVPAMLEVRKLCDGLEKVMPADLYPFPTYAELLFSTQN